MNNIKFSEYHFCSALQSSLDRLGFIHPTPIQEKSIPLALEGKDILGSAQTGTGKTFAFTLPILEKFLDSNSSNETALILAPTRELAAQILKAIHDLLPKNSRIKTALLIGGDPIGKQFRSLDLHPQIVVGTPGRINDHLKRRSLNLKQTHFLVLDEADRMMDMGFEPQIQEIIRMLPEERQTFMFSATLSPSIVKLSQKYLKHPERVAVGEQHKIATNIKQEVIHLKPSQKYAALVKELDKREGSIIVFVKTKQGADDLADKLEEHEHSAKAIHGNLHQRKRDKVIFSFRNKRHRILVATDVAARGLDIPHIEHVINYDLPQTPEDYKHRIGRTARAGKKGEAISFVAPSDARMWKEIQRFSQQNNIQGSTHQEQHHKSEYEHEHKKRPHKNRYKQEDQKRHDKRPTFSQRKDGRYKDERDDQKRFDKKPAFGQRKDAPHRDEREPQKRYDKKPTFGQRKDGRYKDEREDQKRYDKKPSFGQRKDGPYKDDREPQKRYDKKPIFKKQKDNEHKFGDKPKFKPKQKFNDKKKFKSFEKRDIK